MNKIQYLGIYFLILSLFSVIYVACLSANFCARFDDDRRSGSGRCGQEDLLDRHWDEPHRGGQPGRLHEESPGLAEPGQSQSHSPVSRDGVRRLLLDLLCFFKNI